MKVDGITLLQMIKDGKIKENTLIEVSGGVRAHYPYVKFYGNKRLFWEDDDGKCSVVTSDELLEYTFEIIEEIEKPKEIEKIIKIFHTNDIPTDANFKAISDKVEEIRKAVNYLLKKEEK